MKSEAVMRQLQQEAAANQFRSKEKNECFSFCSIV